MALTDTAVRHAKPRAKDYKVSISSATIGAPPKKGPFSLCRDFAGIGHIQIAGVPDRHELDLGEVN